MATAFDTLSAAKALKTAGFDEAGAEAIVSLVRRSAELPAIDHLATKADLGNGLDKLEGRLELFVPSTVLGGAGVIVLAQILVRMLGIAA